MPCARRPVPVAVAGLQKYGVDIFEVGQAYIFDPPYHSHKMELLSDSGHHFLRLKDTSQLVNGGFAVMDMEEHRPQVCSALQLEQ